MDSEWINYDSDGATERIETQTQVEVRLGGTSSTSFILIHATSSDDISLAQAIVTCNMSMRI